MANYYDDQKRLIATSPAELTSYFLSLAGSQNAYQVPNALPCAPLAIIQVKSNGVVPKFLYIGGTQPGNKIYPQLLPSDTSDLTSLCNGKSPGNTLTPPNCGTALFEDINVPVPDCGTPLFASADSNVLAVTPHTAGGWAINGTYTSAVNSAGIVTLNISLVNAGLSGPTSFINELIANISANGRPANTLVIYASNNPNLPAGSVITIDTAGNIFFTGNQTSITTSGLALEFFGIQYNIIQ